MVKISIQFFGGRGSRSGGERPPVITFTQYQTVAESEQGLGYDNGGEADRWEQSLSNAEYQAVADYSGSDFRSLNSGLRKGKEKELDDHFQSVNVNLESALDKYTLEKPTTFVRGSTADLLGGASTVEEINAMAGSIVVDKGFTSSSATVSGAFSGEIKYHIDTPAGKGIGAYIRGISEYGIDENEFLFNKGGMYRVKGAYKEYGDVHVNIEWIGREK